MQKETGKIISLFTPLLLHQTIMLAAALLYGACAGQCGLPYDAALAVLIGNLLVIPAAAKMYAGDGRKIRTEEGLCQAPSLPESGSGRRKERGQRFWFAADGRVSHPLLFGLLCFLGGGLLNVVWSGALNLLRIQELFSNRTQEQLLSAGWVVQVIGLGLAAPVAEELIFRGLTYRRMRRIFPTWTAILLSALLFAVYHGNVVQMLFAFPLAAVLGVIYEYGKLLSYPVLFHMGSNLTAVLVQILISSGA